MKVNQFCLVCAVTLTLCFGTNAAKAQGDSTQTYFSFPKGGGFYYRAGIGASFFQDGQLNNFGGPTSSKVQYKPGLASEVAAGYAFNKYLSTDLELGYVGAEINNVPGYTSQRSYIENVPVLANVIVSYPIPHTYLTPYIGAGAGGSDVIFDTEGFGNGSTTVFGREDEMVFAWQAFAGLNFQLNHRMSFGIGYKFLATEGSSYSYPPAPNFTVGFDGARTHSVLLTFQMKF